MAKPSHRKDHAVALHRRRATQQQAQLLRQEGQPVEVGRNRFKIHYEETGPKLTLDSLAAQADGQTVQIESVTPEGLVTLAEPPPKDASVLIGADYAQIEDRILGCRDREVWKDRCARHMRVLLDPEFQGEARQAYKASAFMDLYGGAPFEPLTDPKLDMGEARELVARHWAAYPPTHVETTPLRAGESRISRNFFLQAAKVPNRNGDVYSREALEKAFGPGCVISEDGSSVYTHTESVLGDTPPAPPQGLARGPARILDYTSELRPYPEELKRWVEDLRRGLSMGCIAEGLTVGRPVPPDGESMITGAKVVKQGPQGHLELGWHTDPVTGEPVFDEVSLCPGPDPNGITDLRPEAQADVWNPGYATHWDEIGEEPTPKPDEK